MVKYLLKIFYLFSKSKKPQFTADQESYLLIHALNDANLPKFLAEDVPLFESILADLFPGITPPQQDQTLLEVCLIFIFV